MFFLLKKVSYQTEILFWCIPAGLMNINNEQAVNIGDVLQRGTLT